MNAEKARKLMVKGRTPNELISLIRLWGVYRKIRRACRKGRNYILIDVNGRLFSNRNKEYAIFQDIETILIRNGFEAKFEKNYGRIFIKWGDYND